MGQVVYVDLRKVPNEVILAAYNEAADFFAASELRPGIMETSEEVEEFKTIIDPYFYGKMDIKIGEIESETKEKLYSLHLSSPVSNDTLQQAKAILKEREEKLKEIRELKETKQRFLNAIKEWEEELESRKEYYLHGGPLLKSLDDVENKFYFSIVLTKGSALVCTIEDRIENSTEPDKEFIHPGIDGFVVYTDYDNKVLVDNLIASLYGVNQTETLAEAEEK